MVDPHQHPSHVGYQPDPPPKPEPPTFGKLDEALDHEIGEMFRELQRQGLQRDQLRDRALPLIALVLISIDDKLGAVLEEWFKGREAAQVEEPEPGPEPSPPVPPSPPSPPVTVTTRR